MFDFIKKAYGKIAQAMSSLFQEMNMRTPTRRELRLDADEFAVKRKLGPSFFTRRLSPNTRAARIASLTQAEYMLACNRRWIRRGLVRRGRWFR